MTSTIPKSRFASKSSSKGFIRFQDGGTGSLTKKYQLLRRCLSSHIFLEACSRCAHYVEKHGPTKACIMLIDPFYHLQAQVLLSKVNRWNFNVFFLENLTNGHGLSSILQNLFQDYNFSKSLGIDMFCLAKFTRLLEQGYHESNPYHNSTHATDVVQAVHFNIQEEKILNFLKIEEQMAVILAAACHDVDHPGVNQSFLINTHNPLATLYHNKSVLENHHYRVTKSLLFMTGLLNHMSKEMWQTVDTILKETILATDISLQQDFLSDFKARLANNSLDLNRNFHKNFILQISLKCADICNPCRPWPLYYRWSELICEEFFKQGDCEARLGIPVVPPFNREGCDLAAVQTGFIQFIAKPLFVEWDKFAVSKKSKMLLKRLHDNEDRWKALLISQTKPTFSELYLTWPVSTYKSKKKVLDVESKNINKSQNKSINMLIAKNYNRKPMKQNLPLKVSNCSSGENLECLEVFYMGRRHSTPSQIPGFLSFRSGKDVIAKNISTHPMTQKSMNKQPTREVEKNVSTRRASFPMNVCITHHSKQDCWNEKSSEGFALTGFLSFLYVTAVSKMVCPKERLTGEIVARPIGLRGVLGFGPQDRMTILCRHLFQYRMTNFKGSKNSLNASGDLSIMTLLTKELFSSTKLS